MELLNSRKKKIMRVKGGGGHRDRAKTNFDGLWLWMHRTGLFKRAEHAITFIEICYMIPKNNLQMYIRDVDFLGSQQLPQTQTFCVCGVTHHGNHATRLLSVPEPSIFTSVHLHVIQVWFTAFLPPFGVHMLATFWRVQDPSRLLMVIVILRAAWRRNAPANVFSI